MKKLITRLLACSLSAAMLLAMAGCGGHEEPIEPSSSASGTSTTTSDNSGAEMPEATDPDKPTEEGTTQGTDVSGNDTLAATTGSGSFNPGPTSKPKPVDPNKVNMGGRTIRLHIGQVEAESTSQVGVKFSQKIKEINQRYNCNIQYYVSYDFDAINASIASGKPSVDIRWFNGYEQFLNAYVAGFVQPLEPLGNVDFNNKDKYAQITDICKIDGQHYGVSPMYYCYGEMRNWFSYIMLYNKDMLKKAGITDDLYKVQTDGNWTLDKFEEYAKKIKNAGMTPLVDVDGHFYKSMLYAYNTDWITYQNSRAHFNGQSAAAKEVLTRYTKLTGNKLIEVPMLKEQGPWPGDSFTYKDYFSKGKCAFIATNGPWALKWLTAGWDKTAKENYGVLLLPKKDKNSPYLTRASADYAFWGIPYGVKKPEEVALVMDALNEPLFKESENLKILQTNMMPLVNDRGSLETLKTLYKMGEPVISYDYLAVGPKVYYGEDGWMMHVQKIANGQESQDAVLKSVVKSYDNLLKDVYTKR